MSCSSFTSFSGSMFVETVLLDKALDFSPLPVYIVQSLGWGIPAEPQDILRNLPPSPGRDVFQGLRINDCLHGLSLILVYATTLHGTFKLKRYDLQRVG